MIVKSKWPYEPEETEAEKENIHQTRAMQRIYTSWHLCSNLYSKFILHLCFNLLLVPCPCLFGLASALWITRVRTDSTRMQIKRIKESLMGGLRAGGGGGGWVGGCDSIPLGFHFGIAPTSLRFIPSCCSPHLDFL